MRLFWHDFHPLWFRSGFYDANLLFFSIGTITSYNGTLTNMGEWTCCMYPVTTYGGRILSFTTSIHRFFFLGVFLLSPSFPILFSKSIGYKYWQKTRYFGGDTPILSCQAEENMYETCTKKCCHQFRELRKQD